MITTPVLTPTDTLRARTMSPAELSSSGLTRRKVSRAVDDGRLLRLRNGRYARVDLPTDLLRAGTIGGRLDCLSLLAMLGIFVRKDGLLHVQIEAHTSRHPSREMNVTAHWRSSDQDRHALAADIRQAVAQAVRCQAPRDAIATLDSALHRRLLDDAGLDAVFRLLPQRFQRLRPLIDSRAESGPETLMRLVLRALGCDLRLQVVVPGVGRVDLIVDGWLIVECDSRSYHDGWDAHRRDRRRDAEAAALGYTTVRILAEDLLHRHDEVVALMKRILSHHRSAVQNSVGVRRFARRVVVSRG